MAHILVVCSRRYNGHELWTTLGILKHRGHSFEVLSTSTFIADEITGEMNKIRRTIDDVARIDSFDAVMFVSGNMQDTEASWSNPRTLSYVDQAIERGIPLAAICCSVPIVRKATAGKKVSYFPLIRAKALLRQEGAILQTVSMTVDGELVTAENQMLTQMWAEAFCDVLAGTPPILTLIDSQFVPGLRPRRPPAELAHLRDVTNRTGKTGVKP